MQRATPIEPDETAQALYDRLAELGGQLVTEAVDAIEQGTATRTPQDESKATLAPMLTRELSPHGSFPVRPRRSMTRSVDCAPGQRR